MRYFVASCVQMIMTLSGWQSALPLPGSGPRGTWLRQPLCVWQLIQGSAMMHMVVPVASTCGRRSRTAGWPRGASLTCVCPQPCSSEGPEGPSGFLERLCFEMKKGYKETMLQLILSPIHIFLSDNYQVRYNPSRVERADWEPQGC